MSADKVTPEARAFGEALATFIRAVNKEHPQAKQGAPLKFDWFAIVTEIAFREATASKKQREKSDLSEAKSVRLWCVKKLKQRPALSELRAIVKLVRGRFRGPE